MKIAIVGTSHKMTENEERDVQQFVAMILRDFSTSNLIVSGGAKGVDTIVIEVAQSMRFPTQIIHTISDDWRGFKKRNMQIATECDQLYCISIPTHETKCYHHPKEQDHEKTAGCWTLRKAKELGKYCRLLVTPSR